MMNLMTGLLGLGGHLGGWRHKHSWTDQVMNLDHAIQLAQTAERGKFDLLFLADGNAVRQMDKPALFAANSPSDRPATFEPLTLLTAVSQHTSSIGLLATATTTYEEPYSLARRFASLDHVSKGRACWNIVTTSYPEDSRNFSLSEHVAKDIRYDRAREFVAVAKGLWDSWAEDAFIQDQATGQFLDPGRVHTLNHVGRHFSVKGPLNVARMPQGWPVLFLAGQSEDGRELAAQHADCVFAVADTKPAAQAFYADVKARLPRYGRTPDMLRIMPGAGVYVGRTRTEADELFDELQSLISPALGVPYLSKLVEADLSAYPIDGPLPDLSGPTLGIASFRKTIADMAARESLTIRQTYQRVLPSMGHTVFKGNPTDIADEMEDWYTSQAADGFNVNIPVLPRCLDDFVELVTPELQRRGLFRREYQGATLRERMGLPIPQKPVFQHIVEGRRMTLQSTRRAVVAGGAAALLVRRPARAATTRMIGCIEEDPPFFNPAISSAISSFVAGSPVYSALVRSDSTGQISGDLAERWEISPDGLTYTFHLRPGITWHDGVGFTAADVTFSLQNANAKLHPYRGALNAIVAFEAPDDDTVVLRLSHPQGSLMISLTNFVGSILPRHIWEGKDLARDPHNRAPIGTGPFRFVEFKPGEHILYAKWDKYFLKGLPAGDELMFRIIPDPAARVAAFENGEIDMIYASALPASSIERLRKLPGVAMRFSKMQQSGYLAYINMRNAPFSDKRVRQALAYAIDRGFMRSTVFPGGLATNMIGSVSPNSDLVNKTLKDYPLDPAKAEALLDEAGFKRGADGTRFNLRYVFAAGDLPATKIGDVMARNLAGVGIKVILRPLDRGAYMQVAFVNNEFDMVAGSFNLGPDPDVGIERFYNSRNIFNIPFVNNSPYVNPEIDRLFDEQRVQLDPAKRKAIYDKIQEILWEDIPVFPFCAYSLPGAVHEDLKGVFYSLSSLVEDFAFAKPTT